MTASGYADLLGKVTSGADWLVADALQVEKIDPRAGRWCRTTCASGPAARPSCARGPAIHRTPGGGFDHVGLGMQSYESSRTASGAEHQFSHLWEMEGLGKDAQPPLSHGFKQGVGSVAIAALYELLLERDLADLDIEALKDSWPTRKRWSTRCGRSIRTPSWRRAPSTDPRQVHQRR